MFIAATNAATTKSPIKLPNKGVPTSAVSGDILLAGNLDNEDESKTILKTTPSTFIWKWVKADNGGGYIETGLLPNEYTGPCFAPEEQVPAGKYKLTFYVRTVYEGHKTVLCAEIHDTNKDTNNHWCNGYYKTGSDVVKFFNVEVTDEWQKVEFYFQLDAPMHEILIRGVPSPILKIPFCVDEVSLVPVTDSQYPATQKLFDKSKADWGTVNNSTASLDYIDEYADKKKWDPEEGINMWLSIRMNDHHDRNLEYSSLFTEYYFEHPEHRRINPATYPTLTAKDTFSNLLSYAIPEVRDTFLALVNESLDRYDVYGYQYEFQRNHLLFPIGMEYSGIEIMNQFMRDTDQILSVYEEKYGHEIKMAVQVPADLQTNYDCGLDVMTWVSEGIVDMVSPTGKWNTIYNELPVKMWKSLLDPYGVELIPCMEHGLSINVSKGHHISPNIEQYAGSAALYLSQGADKLQLYNILIPLYFKFKETEKLAEYDTSFEIPETASGTTAGIGWWILLTTCGSYDKLMTMNRSIIPTYHDTSVTGKPSTYTAQFPIFLPVGYSKVFQVGIGDVPEGATVTLKIAAIRASEEKAPTVYVNSTPCKFVGIEESPDLRFTSNSVYCFELPESVHDDMFAVVEVTSAEKNSLNSDYAEIYIEPAK